MPRFRVGFGDKVALRTFHEVTPDKEILPWRRSLVRPLVTTVDGVRSVSVDKEWEAADVRPDDGDDGDAAFQQFSDHDDDEHPGRPQPFTPPQRAAHEAHRAAAEVASADLALEPPCVRCGAAEHAANACTLFLRDRGAQRSPDAARHGVSRDIGDDGTRAGIWSNAAVVVLVPETPDSLYAALTLAVRGLGANFMRAKAVTRKALGSWIRRHGDTQVAGQMLRDWVAFETDKGWRQVAQYADWMALDTSWAGPIDCAAFAALRGISVHVWRRVPSSGGFQRHASFDPPAGPAAHTVNLLHSRGRHYDVLRIERRRSPVARLCVLAPTSRHCLLCLQPRRGARLSARRRLRQRPLRPARRTGHRPPHQLTTQRTFSTTCAGARRFHFCARCSPCNSTLPSHPASPVS